MSTRPKKLAFGIIRPGATGMELVLALPAILPRLGSITLTYYSPSPTAEERLRRSGSVLLRRLASRAAALKRKCRIQELGWEFLLALSTRMTGGDHVIREALRHEPKTIELIEINLAELTVKRLREEEIRAQSTGRALAICSRCTLTDGAVGHLPMIDFRVQPGKRSLSWARSALQHIGQQHGAILKSGRSYHYYGFQILGPDQWRTFMETCVLLAPCVDGRYVAHRLLQGVSVLRVGRSQLKPTVPHVIDVF